MDDLKFALRALRKAPAFCLVVIATLALGIGANTAVFSVLHAAVLTPLPYAEPERLVRVYLERDGEVMYLPGAAMIDLRDTSRTLDIASVYTYSEAGVDLTDRGRPERVAVTYTSANYFDVMRVTPLAGRPFARADERRNARVAVISERLWREYLGADRSAIGRTLTMSGAAVQVVGVVPAWFEDPLQPRVEVWMPEDLQVNDTNTWGNNRLSAVARIRDGFTFEDAVAEGQVLAARQAPNYSVPRSLRLVPLQGDVVGAAGPMLFILLGAVGLLLLLACVNVASLLLARAAGRAQEITVRAALGSSRWRLVRQLLTESVVLSLAGGLAGLALAFGVSRVLLAAAPVAVRADAALNWQVFAYCLGVAFLAGLAFGVVPALHASRPDLDAVLRESGRSGGTGRRQARIWNALVISQVGVALVLLVSAGLLLRSFQRLQRVDLGISAEHVLTFEVTLPSARYEAGAERSRFHRALQQRLAALPGVRAVGAVSRLPVTGTYHTWGTRIPGTEGWPVQPQQRVVEGDYFAALGIPVLHGRVFGPEDHAGVERRVVVSETVARTLFPNLDPLGRDVQVLGARVRIIGVVPDVALSARGLRAPAVYHSHTQFADNRNWALTQVVATDGAAPGLVDAIRREVAAIDSQLVVHQPQPLEDVIGRGQARERFSLQLIGAFAGLALVLAAIGLYGVLAYAVTSRRQEIGIRLALGAPPASVRRMFVRTGGVLTALGVAAGGLLAFALTRGLQSLLFEITATDPWVFAGAALLLAAVAAIAAWLPARAATRVDPLEVLGR